MKFRTFGNILKTFGTNGELIVKIDNQFNNEINLAEPIFIIIDGLSVPFYFLRFEERANGRALVVFDDVETEKLASELVGKQMLLPFRKKIKERDFDLSNFVGFKITDKNDGAIGVISDFMDIPNNPCFQVLNGKKEIIIPIHDDFIESVDADSKTIFLNLPDGLVDIY